MLDAILVDLKAVKKKYRSDVIIKDLNYAIREYFSPKKEYGYIAN